MGIFDKLFTKVETKALARRVRSEAAVFYDLNDPRLPGFLREGAETQSGAVVNTDTALRNTAVFRCVDLISSTIGMLPLNLMRRGHNSGDLSPATDHALFDILNVEPNAWQSAFEFKAQMQANALLHGNGFARIVRSMGQVKQLIPLDPTKITISQKADWSIEYTYQRPDGGRVTLRQEDMFHLRGLSVDGILGLSRTKVAREAIGLALQAELAAGRLFKYGTMVGGALIHPDELGDEGFERLETSLREKYSGADNAHKWLILEEGMEAKPFSPSARDSQHIELRAQQMEEVARAFGVPRPLLMLDDTSWGSGIEQLGILFVRFGLAPWFVTWEQTIARALLTKDERRTLFADFDEQELLRGSMKDQAEYFAKASGAGGHKGWLEPNEIRKATGWGPHPDGKGLQSSTQSKAPKTPPSDGDDKDAQ